MFLELTHAESQRIISIRADDIMSIDPGKESTVVQVGMMRIEVRESRKEILDLIKKTTKGDKNGKQSL